MEDHNISESSGDFVKDSREAMPLITVIIPCFNHAHYLDQAIGSVLNQTYSHLEIIVVDDGSTDYTSKVASSYHLVRYIYQANAGLSNARNTGISHSKGELLVFLDADDVLLPNALEVNQQYLLKNTNAAFVSGSYINRYENEKENYPKDLHIESNHYLYFLQYNFIGMVAAVMFRRFVFDQFRFDESLKGSEDHSIYLQISRNHEVIHHSEKLAIYRRHTQNMSNNIPMMVTNALIVLKNQRKFLKTKEERNAYTNSYRSLYAQFFFSKNFNNKDYYNVFKEDKYYFYAYKLLGSILHSKRFIIKIIKPKK